ncbi:MAG: hypothetical protein M1548_10270 [Actinobacteria bacterium]|nr:hypothetical protein [Actinomycetota bacterium]
MRSLKAFFCSASSLILLLTSALTVHAHSFSFHKDVTEKGMYLALVEHSESGERPDSGFFKTFGYYDAEGVPQIKEDIREVLRDGSIEPDRNRLGDHRFVPEAERLFERYYRQAITDWQNGDTESAMSNLASAGHMIEDATSPDHLYEYHLDGILQITLWRKTVIWTVPGHGFETFESGSWNSLVPQVGDNLQASMVDDGKDWLARQYGASGRTMKQFISRDAYYGAFRDHFSYYPFKWQTYYWWMFLSANTAIPKVAGLIDRFWKDKGREPVFAPEEVTEDPFVGAGGDEQDTGGGDQEPAPVEGGADESSSNPTVEAPPEGLLWNEPPPSWLETQTPVIDFNNMIDSVTATETI